MILLYAIIPAGQPPAPMWKPGAELRVVAHGTLAAVYEELESTRAASIQELTDYGAVLTDLMQRCPLLPVRFGTVLDSVEDLRELLSSRQDVWAERLSRIAGNVEVIVHVPDSGAGPNRPETGSGRDYLLARVAAH